MAHTVISSKYPPQIDVTRTPLAYGDRALPRLNRELKDHKLLTRQRAVMSLCDYLHDPEHIAAALEEGIAESLKVLLKDPDVTIRLKSTECLFVFGGHAIGRAAFLSGDAISPVSSLFDDQDNSVRKNAHKATKMFSETAAGAEAIVKANLIPKLVKKLKSEHDDIKILILDTLHFCMKIDTDSALSHQAMETFTILLSHSSPQIRAKAARDIMDLSFSLPGKDKAVEVKCVRILVKLLKDENSDVRAKSAGALMVITITTRGKYTALEAEAITPLVGLLTDKVSEVRLNSLKALTCLSEAPEGRKILLEFVNKIEACVEDHIPAVSKAATIAVKVVTWEP